MTKILFFIDCLGPGGKERRVVELLKGLKKSSEIEFEIVLMCKTVHYTEVFDLNARIHYLLRKTKKDLTVFHRFYKICKIYKPDIVHCWDSMTAVYSVPACKLLGIKLVNGMVSDAPTKQDFSNNSRLLAKVTFPFSDKIIGNSRAGIEAYKAPKHKSVVIYNGFNFSRVQKIENPAIIRDNLRIDGEYVVGMVASYSKFKDYATYLRAAERLLRSRNDIVFLLIGQDTDSIELKSLIPIENQGPFRFLGKHKGIESLINVMDICVLATFTEGISNSIMEYMAMGKPVVATSGGGTNEILEDQMTGFLVNASNAVELADAIEVFLNNPDLRHRMGGMGKERIKKVFSIDRMVDEYLLIYEKLN